MENFLFAFRADAPILLTIFSGTLFAGLVKWDKAVFKKLNVIIFRLLIPAQIFYSVYSIEDMRAVNWRMVGFSVICAPVCLLLGLLIARFLIPERQQKGVIIQASFRSNAAVIGTSLVAAIGTVSPAESLALASLIVCALAIVNNIMAVIVLKHYGNDSAGFGDILKGIARNPLVIGAVSGGVLVLVRELLLKYTGVRLDDAIPSVLKVIYSFSKASSPLALFCLGALLDFKAGKAMKREIAIGTGLRLILCPAVIFTAAFLLRNSLSLTKIEIPALVAFAASPVATVTAIMAQEMGSDAQLANHLVVWSSVFSVLTLLLITFLLRSTGWL